MKRIGDVNTKTRSGSDPGKRDNVPGLVLGDGANIVEGKPKVGGGVTARLEKGVHHIPIVDPLITIHKRIKSVN